MPDSTIDLRKVEIGPNTSAELRKRREIKKTEQAKTEQQECCKKNYSQFGKFDLTFSSFLLSCARCKRPMEGKKKSSLSFKQRQSNCRAFFGVATVDGRTNGFLSRIHIT